MTGDNGGQAGITANREESGFRQVSESQLLRRAPAMRALLLYLWEHREQPLSEYAVGTEALGRKADFDPKLDATVRVQVSRLRSKLKEYYETEGQDSELRISIPLGGHQLVVSAAPADAPAVIAPPAAAPRSRSFPWTTLALSLALVLIGWLGYRNHSLEEQLAADPRSRELPPFWKSFFAGPLPTSLVLPTPIFFYWEDRRLVVRDSHVNEFGQRNTSSQLRALEAQHGMPSLLQHYTVASDTSAALKLSQYLGKHGQQLFIATAPELPVDSFGDRNLIFLGSPGTSEHLQQLLAGANFFMTPGTTGVVRNRAPLSGEDAAYAETRRGDRRSIVPGIVSLFPGKVRPSRILLLSSRSPAGLVTFLISPQGLESLERKRAEAGSPEYFECVVLAETEGDSVLKASLAALRPLRLNH